MLPRLFIPLFIPLLILAAYLGWNWYQVKHFMDSLIEQAAPYASISYQSIPIAYKGEYSVKGVSVDLFNAGIPVTIDEVKLNASDWQLLLLMGTPFETDQVPQQMALVLSGLQFNTEAQAAAQPMIAIMLEQPLLEGCIKADGQPVVLRDLRYGELNATIEMGYRFDSGSQIINVNTGVHAARMSTMDIGIDFDVNASQLSKQALELNPPQLVGVTMDYQDQGYNAKLIEVCAGHRGLSTEDFVDLQVSLAAEQANEMGMELSEALLALYRELMLPGVNAKLVMDLRNPLPVNAAPQAFSSNSILDTVDLKMSINQQPVAMPELLFAINQSMNSQIPMVADQPVVPAQPFEQVAAVAEREPELVESQADTQPGSEPEPIDQPEYETVAVNQITSSLVGLEVKVDTNNGHLVTGKILKVANDRMIVRQEIGNGVAEMPLLYKNARRVQVLR